MSRAKCFSQCLSNEKMTNLVEQTVTSVYMIKYMKMHYNLHGNNEMMKNSSRCRIKVRDIFGLPKQSQIWIGCTLQ